MRCILKKSILLVILSGLLLFRASAQEGNKNPLKGAPLKDRIFTGGNLGLSFGTITNIYLAPVLGYRVTPRLSTGVGVIYNYVKDTRYTPDLTYSSYGFNLFSRYAVVGPLFVQAEYEYLNYEYFPFGAMETARTGFNSLFLGGGIAQPLGRNAAILVSAFYNVTYREGSNPPPPYRSPWVFRVGITAGF